MTAFAEVADRVYVLRYPVLDVNVTLVLGDTAALLVDTLSTAGQATELAAAARTVTAHPWLVVNTHHHFDHCFGNATVSAPGTPIWGHEEAAGLLREQGEVLRRQWCAQWAATDGALATGMGQVRIVPPTHTVRRDATLDVGGRPVTLHHFGRGHTAGDLVVHVPDADVVVAGDLVEQSGPPDFSDGYPLEWPETLAALAGLTTPRSVVVPGHGAVVDPVFVAAQHAELTALAWLIRDGHADGAGAAAVAARAPYAGPAAEVAVRRGYAELSGTA